MSETTRLAATIERWWPQIERFLPLGVTNARTEGYNRVIKQIRVACGFGNQTNYEGRIMWHTATRRAALSAAVEAVTPPKWGEPASMLLSSEGCSERRGRELCDELRADVMTASGKRSCRGIEAAKR